MEGGDAPTLRVTVLNAQDANRMITEAIGNSAHESITKNIPLRVAISQYLLPLINESTVPMSPEDSGHSGHLRSTAHVNRDDGRMRWGAGYGWFVYNGISGYGDIHHWTTPGTGAYWVKMFMRDGSHWSGAEQDHVAQLIRDYYAKGLAK